MNQYASAQWAFPASNVIRKPSARLRLAKAQQCAASVLAAVILTLGQSGYALAADPGKPAISDGVVKIGVLTDMSGAYADTAGRGSVEAARMAVEDFGGTVEGNPIEVVFADHQNKADVGSATARRWFDVDHVDAIFDVNNTAVHFAVANLALEKNRLIFNTAAASSAITGEQCSPVVVHYPYDTYALAKGTVKAVMAQGAKSWYMVAVDYTFGANMVKDIERFVKENGGTVKGVAKHPLNASDFSSYLLSAQASGADVIGLANVANDMINTARTASQFQILPNQKIAATVMFVTDVHALGLEAAQGMYATTAFYWDRDEETRAWSRRFEKRTGKIPTQIHAAAYSAVTTYLKTIAQVHTDDAGTVMAAVKTTPINDFFAKNGRVREDGRMVHDLYLVQVKTPAESKYPWDYYKIISTIPGDEAFRPLSEGNCPLVKKS